MIAKTIESMRLNLFSWRRFASSCLVCLLVSFAFSVLGHSGGVNSHGCHTPGGQSSGNACHCHPPGKRSPDLPCKDGQPVEDEDDDQSGSDAEKPADKDAVIELFKGLVVAKEETCSPYDRDDCGYSAYLDVIKAAELGGIHAVYEDLCYSTYRDVHIEHLVAIKEAHDSGLCKADPQTKIDFANDLDNIVMASPSVNIGKSAKDASEWLPDHQQCWFAAQVIHVKTKYGLTIDEAERDALKEVLDNCSYNDIELVVKTECEIPEEASP